VSHSPSGAKVSPLQLSSRLFSSRKLIPQLSHGDKYFRQNRLCISATASKPVNDQLTSSSNKSFVEQEVPEISQQSTINFTYRRGFEDRYELLDIIGEGGFGVVHRARSKYTDEEYAVKVLKKGELDTDTKVERLRHEVLHQLEMGPSRNIAYLYQVFEDEDHVYLLMELCRGGDLWRRIKVESGKFYNEREPEAARLITGVLEAVAACHERGIIVRDIKPHNFVFLTDEVDSPLKLTDFGLADSFDVHEIDGEPFNQQVGTSRYMAPEVVGRFTDWPPTVAYGPKADVWGVGVLFYQLMTGNLPFKMESPSKELESKDVFMTVALGPLDFECEAWTNLSPKCRDMIQQLLTRDPEQRPHAKDALKHEWLLEGASACSLTSFPPRSVYVPPRSSPL